MLEILMFQLYLQSYGHKNNLLWFTKSCLLNNDQKNK